MAKPPKSRKKKYRPRYTVYSSPLANRPLSEEEIERLRNAIDVARLKMRLSSADRTATDRLAVYLGYGYSIADNFERSDELKARFVKAMQALHRARWAIDLKQPVAQDDISVIDESLEYAFDEICTLDLASLKKLESYFIEHGQKLFDMALAETGGNKVIVCTRAEYEKMLKEGKLPEGAVLTGAVPSGENPLQNAQS